MSLSVNESKEDVATRTIRANMERAIFTEFYTIYFLIMLRFLNLLSV